MLWIRKHRFCGKSSLNNPFGRLGREAFTLIELLVVISIISILIAILLPALRKAKESAGAAQCMATIRQLGMISAVYGEDHNQKMIPYYMSGFTPGSKGRWTRVWLDRSYVPNEKILFDPTFVPDRQEKPVTMSSGSHAFAYNRRMPDVGQSGAEVQPGIAIGTDQFYRLDLIKNPGQYIQFADSVFPSSGVYYQNYYIPTGSVLQDRGIHLRHNKAANLSFADGHADAQIKDEILTGGHFFSVNDMTENQY